MGRGTPPERMQLKDARRVALSSPRVGPGSPRAGGRLSQRITKSAAPTAFLPNLAGFPSPRGLRCSGVQMEAPRRVGTGRGSPPARSRAPLMPLSHPEGALVRPPVAPSTAPWTVPRAHPSTAPAGLSSRRRSSHRNCRHRRTSGHHRRSAPHHRDVRRRHCRGARCGARHRAAGRPRRRRRPPTSCSNRPTTRPVRRRNPRSGHAGYCAGPPRTRVRPPRRLPR